MTFKFLQINLLIEQLDELIKSGLEDIYANERAGINMRTRLPRIASLKVFKKKLASERQTTNLQMRGGFRSEHEMLVYSWNLFKDKIN